MQFDPDRLQGVPEHFQAVVVGPVDEVSAELGELGGQMNEVAG
jgi:hypothetical protein